MLRSLYSGISGLHAHQQMMDVTGNNIANVNTVGFKTQQVQFKDTLSQMVGAAGSPQNGQAGTNPAQVGLVVRVAGISQNFTQGSAQTTGKSGDMMISGDGFFMTRSGGEVLYTRAGSFAVDANGTLTSSTGEPVQGWTGVNGIVNASGKPGDIRIPLGDTIPPKATGAVNLKGNLSTDVTPDPNNPTNTGVAYNTIIPVKVFDAKGESHTVTAKFQRTAVADQWDVTMVDDQTPPVAVGVPTKINFVNGKPVLPTLTLGSYTVDVSDVTSYSGISDARVFQTDGQTAGSLTSLAFTVSDTGEIVGVYNNGLKQVLGQVSMATFANPEGLEKVGNSMYRNTVNSGYAQIGTPGSAGMGSVMSGALEMSNVDLAQEFTNLVIAQRGFQANSKIITTSDELLQELVSMKR